MKTGGDKIEAFSVTAVKPGFSEHEEKGQSAFETLTEQSFSGKWKIIYTYPKDFTLVCPTEIAGFAKLAKDFEDRDTGLLSGSNDNEFCKLGGRRDRKDLSRLNHWQFADTTGVLVDQLGIREKTAGVALRDFHRSSGQRIQHVSVNSLNVGRNPDEVLRLLDGLQTDELCPCNRAVGGATLQPIHNSVEEREPVYTGSRPTSTPGK